MSGLKLKATKLFSLAAPRGGDMLVMHTDTAYADEEMRAVDKYLRGKYPSWDGVLLVLRTEETIERMPEPMARILYEKLGEFFAKKDNKNTTTEGATDERRDEHDGAEAEQDVPGPGADSA